MNRMERHLKKVNKANRAVTNTLNGASDTLADLKKHRDFVSSQIVENNKIIEDLTDVNTNLAATYKDLGKTITSLENLLEEK